MKDTETNTKRDLFLATMHAVIGMYEAIKVLNEFGIDDRNRATQILDKQIDTAIDELEAALNLMPFLSGYASVSWWLSYYLMGVYPHVTTGDEEDRVIDSPEELWTLMEENGEV